MLETYQEMKKRHEEEFSQFSEGKLFWAFNDEQFEEGMAKIGLTKDDTDKIYSMGCGGYILKTESKNRRELFEKWEKELEENAKNSQFATDMFEYELANHEYGYTGDLEPTLDALGYTIEEINNNEILLEALKIAIKKVREYECFV